jgi:MtN3 and saliva related transmembrane protein
VDPRFIGYASSLVLVLTIVTQIRRQWRTSDDSGVSPWLFAGQLAASSGFTVYSLATGDRIFVVTNACMALAACVGLGIVVIHRRRRTGAAG